MAQKVLVIDDDADSLKLISLLLVRQGYEVQSAPGGQEGLAQATNDKPDLVLLDVMMPDMDGYQVCRRLRQDPELAHIPVLMFTAKTRVDDKAAGFDSGADDYLTKPTHPAELASRVGALLSRGSKVTRPAVVPSKAKVVAILGVRGGSGVTTLAVNLSAVMAELGKQTILADLCYGAGAVGQQLGHPQADGLSHLYQFDPEELTQEQVMRELVDYSPRFRLLLTAYRPLESNHVLPTAHTESVIQLLARHADVVLLDLGSHGGASLTQILSRADSLLICLPAQHTILSIAHAMIQYLRQAGLDTLGSGFVLMNAGCSPPTLTARDLGMQTRVPVVATLPAEPEFALRALDLRKPMVTLEPESVIAKRFRELGARTLEGLDQGRLRARR